MYKLCLPQKGRKKSFVPRKPFKNKPIKKVRDEKSNYSKFGKMIITVMDMNNRFGKIVSIFALKHFKKRGWEGAPLKFYKCSL